MVFGLAAGTLAVAGAGAVDYATMMSTRAQLQAAADGAATAAARELYLMNSKDSQIQSAAEILVKAKLSVDDSVKSYVLSATINKNRTAVTAKITATPVVNFTDLLRLSDLTITVKATAQIMGSGKICAIALNPSAGNAIAAKNSARITARNCAVYSNSTNKIGIVAQDGSRFVTELTCSAGGYSGSSANFAPIPEKDCPPIPDPLAQRPAPPVGSCLRTDLVLIDGSHILSPGVYCGGLDVTEGAKVFLKPGVYVLKDGNLQVKDNSEFVGKNVGLYFKGTTASLRFGPDTLIDLTAPKDGPMAGLLMFGDRTASGRTFVIASNNARNLLGTIYLPNGVFTVHANNPVADKSAYTVLVVRGIRMFEGPELVLNSNYKGSDIPVPSGVGPVGNNIVLTE